MQGLNSLLNNSQFSSLNDYQHGFEQSSSHDEYLEQFLLSSCSWPATDLSIEDPTYNGHDSPPPESHEDVPSFHHFDESSFLAAKLRQHHISGAPAMATMIQQQMMMMSRGGAATDGMERSPASIGSGDSGFVPLPLSLSGGDLVDRSQNDVIDSSVRGLVNGSTGSLNGSGQLLNQNHQFHLPQVGTMQAQNFGAPAASINGAQPNGSNGGGAPTQPRQRIRARRGQATDPHSIAERLRRERIAERMKALQELVPNANKTDKASMLDEIIDYVKFLQLQVKVLSMSRLGGAPAVAPLGAGLSSEGRGEQTNGGLRRISNGTQSASTNDSMSVTEHQVAKLMEEDMGSAMQYLQGKGLCLMPISLATAISTATSHSRSQFTTTTTSKKISNGAEGPSSPNMSALTVQSAMMGNNASIDGSIKDTTSVSKP